MSEELIYHYTSAEGLKGIINEQAIHCTNCLFLNDLKEYFLVVHLLKNNFNAVCIDEDTSLCLKASLTRLLDMTETLFIGLKEYSAAYISSFSSKGDLLSQWRGYCPNGGYSLGFSKKILEKSARNQQFKMKVVEYVSDHDKPASLINSLSEFFKRFKKEIPALTYDPTHYNIRSSGLRALLPLIPPEGKTIEEVKKEAHKIRLLEKKFGLVLHFTLMDLMPFYKDQTFKEEEEIRVASISNETLYFKCSGNLLKPYRRLEFEQDALKEIIIGPTSNIEQCELGVNLFLQSQNIGNVTVKRSEIPYRSSH